MEKFTKGEWAVVDGNYPCFIDVKLGDKTRIPFVWSAYDLSSEDSIEIIANAHLIAAAPEMYEMLESLASQDGCQMFKFLINKLLAKARGEK